MANILEVLPPEILTCIFRFFNPRTLASLARLCKPLHQLVLPHLYHHIELDGHRSKGIKHLRPLTFLLLQRPEIAAMVYAITVRNQYRINEYGSEEQWRLWPDHPDLDDVLKRAIHIQLGRSDVSVNRDHQPADHGKIGEKHDESLNGNESMSGHNPQHWFQIVRAGRHEAAILALLLPNLVNLRSMDLPIEGEMHGWDRGITSHFIAQMFERAVNRSVKMNNRPIFSNLRDVIIPRRHDMGPEYPDIFANCVHLPAIRRLYSSNQSCWDNADTFVELKTRTSSLELIHLRYFKLTSACLLELLKAPICLKTLVYEVGESWEWIPFSSVDTQSAVEVQRESLERLCLSTSHEWDQPFTSGSDVLQPMSFTNLPALKHLQISPIFVFGNDLLQLDPDRGYRLGDAPQVTQQDLESSRLLLIEALPRQLETLGLLYCNDPSTLDRLKLCIEELLRHKDDAVPYLHEVSILIFNDSGSEAIDRTDQFTGLPWNEKNIRLVIYMESESHPFEQNNNVRWDRNDDVEWAWVFHSSAIKPSDILYDSREESDLQRNIVIA